MTSRKYIIEYCTNEFVSHGVKSIRMDDLAAGMGISKRTIYEIFGDRESLITECIKYHLENREKVARESLKKADNVIEEILFFLDNSESIIKGNMMFMAEVKKFHFKVYEKLINAHHNRMNKDMRNILEKGIQDGVFIPTLNIELSVYILTDSLYSIMSRAESNKVDKVLDMSLIQAIILVVTYFLRGISTVKGVEIIDKYMNKVDAVKTINE